MIPRRDEPKRETRVKDGDMAVFYAGVQALSNDVWRDCLVLLLFSGLRLTEAASLRWDDKIRKVESGDVKNPGNGMLAW
jgi:hypothetical protein